MSAWVTKRALFWAGRWDKQRADLVSFVTAVLNDALAHAKESQPAAPPPGEGERLSAKEERRVVRASLEGVADFIEDSTPNLTDSGPEVHRDIVARVRALAQSWPLTPHAASTDRAAAPEGRSWEEWNEAIEQAARAVEDTEQVEATADTYYAQLGDAAATRKAAAFNVRGLKRGGDHLGSSGSSTPGRKP